MTEHFRGSGFAVFAKLLEQEGTEVRAFCIKHPEDPDRIKAIPVPEDIKALCS